MTAMTMKQSPPSGVTTYTPRMSKFKIPSRQLPLTMRSGMVGSRVLENQTNYFGNQIGRGSSILNNLRKRYTHRGLTMSQRLTPSPVPENSMVECHVLGSDEEHSPLLAATSTHFRATGNSSESCRTQAARSASCLLKVKAAFQTTEPIKFGSPFHDDNIDADETDVDTDEETVSSDSESEAVVDTRNRKKASRSYSVCFDRQVTVVEIPHRLTYTLKQRHRMWNGIKTIQENAKRNRLEYGWEGSEWENAIEEDEFCDINGENVHPFHLS
jgi:hypothetical protein